MKKISTVFAVAALATLSMSASAWWGGPDSHGYGDNAPNYGGYPYAMAPAVALTEEQQTAMAEQHKAFAEQQAKAFQEAMEAQRIYAEQFAGNLEQMPAPFADHAIPFRHQPFNAPFDTGFEEMDARAEEMRKMMEERRNQFAGVRPSNAQFANRDARVEEMRKLMEERRTQFTAARPSDARFADRDARGDEMRKMMEERRKEMNSVRPSNPAIPADLEVRRAEMEQQMQQRRDEMLKRVEAQRATTKKS